MIKARSKCRGPFFCAVLTAKDLLVFVGRLEHFHKICSDELIVLGNSGLFGFWLRFSSVAGFLNLRLR
jgi:hypothetical protein